MKKIFDISLNNVHQLLFVVVSIDKKSALIDDLSHQISACFCVFQVPFVIDIDLDVLMGHLELKVFEFLH